jgi:hypothetical protein
MAFVACLRILFITVNTPSEKRKKCDPVEVGKNRLQLILFSKITGAFLFRTFGGFLHVPTTQIYCLTGAMISETHNNNI